MSKIMKIQIMLKFASNIRMGGNGGATGPLMTGNKTDDRYRYSQSSTVHFWCACTCYRL